MNEQIRELIDEARDGMRTLLDAKTSGEAILLRNDDGTFDLDEWAKYVNEMLRRLTAQVGQATILAISVAVEQAQEDDNPTPPENPASEG